MVQQGEDGVLLKACRDALARPFVDPVVFEGYTTPRRTVRQVERLLLRLGVQKRAAGAPQHKGCAA